MREIRLSRPQFALINVTRGLFGLGAGLLLSGRLRRHTSRLIGAIAAALGGLSTIPLAIGVIRRQRRIGSDGYSVAATYGHESITAD